jgi:hypothetical protein
LNTQQRNMLLRRRKTLAETLRKSTELGELPTIEQRRAIVILDQVNATPQELAKLSVADRLWLAEGFSAAEAPQTYVADVDHIRTRVLNEFDRRGKGNCEEREVIARLPNRLDSSAQAYTSQLASSYLSILVGCVCDLVNPPCPQCTETRVPLARIRIEDCRVTDVCGLVRQWVLTPRTLNYWLPIAELLREILLSRCCGERRRPQLGHPTRDEGQIITRSYQQALSLLRSPIDAPEFRELVEMLAEPVVSAPHTPAEPAPAAVPPPPPAASDDRVKMLEDQVAALGEELKRLTGQPAPVPASPASPGVGP